ncbi:hypothetical protein [Thiolapillus brandeum]|uniref:SHOCT domain-containing protein n=1 Tax=Thiolapillus brandeum TaxID=1076588 RepID=A0A7U6JJN0_9GAMM|nr:hypothetical protein [Thiolapillus brandeum]BAO45055.1 hypothetical protein TBH_C2143 [Thiolapillus brandeum]
MKLSSILLASTLAFSLFALQGCGGGGAKVSSSVTTTTMGEELQDLETSYNKGLLTEDEYKTARKAILKRYQ